MKDCLVLSSGKNKSSVFNGLQAKLTGLKPVALTTSLKWIVEINTMT